MANMERLASLIIKNVKDDKCKFYGFKKWI